MQSSTHFHLDFSHASAMAVGKLITQSYRQTQNFPPSHFCRSYPYIVIFTLTGVKLVNLSIIIEAMPSKYPWQ